MTLDSIFTFDQRDAGPDIDVRWVCWRNIKDLSQSDANHSPLVCAQELLIARDGFSKLPLRQGAPSAKENKTHLWDLTLFFAFLPPIFYTSLWFCRNLIFYLKSFRLKAEIQFIKLNNTFGDQNFVRSS